MSGKLASAALVNGVTTLVYTVPAGKVASVNINVVNRGNDASKVSIAIGTGALPANADFIEFEASVSPKSVLERTGVVLSPGEKIWFLSNGGESSVRIHGFLEG